MSRKNRNVGLMARLSECQELRRQWKEEAKELRRELRKATEHYNEAMELEREQQEEWRDKFKGANNALEAQKAENVKLKERIDWQADKISGLTAILADPIKAIDDAKQTVADAGARIKELENQIAAFESPLYSRPEFEDGSIEKIAQIANDRMEQIRRLDAKTTEQRNTIRRLEADLAQWKNNTWKQRAELAARALQQIGDVVVLDISKSGNFQGLVEDVAEQVEELAAVKESITSVADMFASPRDGGSARIRVLVERIVGHILATRGQRPTAKPSNMAADLLRSMMYQSLAGSTIGVAEFGPSPLAGIFRAAFPKPGPKISDLLEEMMRGLSPSLQWHVPRPVDSGLTPEQQKIFDDEMRGVPRPMFPTAAYSAAIERVYQKAAAWKPSQQQTRKELDQATIDGALDFMRKIGVPESMLPTPPTPPEKPAADLLTRDDVTRAVGAIRNGMPIIYRDDFCTTLAKRMANTLNKLEAQERELSALSRELYATGERIDCRSKDIQAVAQAISGWVRRKAAPSPDSLRNGAYEFLRGLQQNGGAIMRADDVSIAERDAARARPMIYTDGNGVEYVYRSKAQVDAESQKLAKIKMALGEIDDQLRPLSARLGVSNDMNLETLAELAAARIAETDDSTMPQVAKILRPLVESSIFGTPGGLTAIQTLVAAVDTVRTVDFNLRPIATKLGLPESIGLGILSVHCRRAIDTLTQPGAYSDDGVADWKDARAELKMLVNATKAEFARLAEPPREQPEKDVRQVVADVGENAKAAAGTFVGADYGLPRAG